MPEALAQIVKILKLVLSFMTSGWTHVRRARARLRLHARNEAFDVPFGELEEPTLNLSPQQLGQREAAGPSLTVDAYVEDEDTSTDVIYLKANPVDLSGLIERTESPPSNAPPVPSWEVLINGETLGPFTRQEILDGLQDGTFSKEIQVREHPAQEWLSVAALIVEAA